MSEIRRDRLHNCYVLIAPERMHRPDHLQSKEDPEKEKKHCPFCEGHESLTPPEIFALRDNGANETNWKTRVVPNLYKAVQVELEAGSKREGIFESINGVGAHEILIDSPCHECTMASMEVTAIRDWLRSIARRIEDLRKDRRLVSINVFKNHGLQAGATQAHPHTQIIALPIMPGDTITALERGQQYYKRHGRGKLEDLLENERREGTRIIEEIGRFCAYAPFASSYPFEVMIAPRAALVSLEALNRDDMLDLAKLIKEIFMRLQKQLGDFHYNLAFNMAPLNPNFENAPYMDDLHHYYRFSLRIMPRIYRLGGFELSTGMMINVMEPEAVAALLREVKL